MSRVETQSCVWVLEVKCFFYSRINWCYRTVLRWICCTDILRIGGTRVYASGYRTHGNKYCYIRPGIDRTRKNADKRSQINTVVTTMVQTGDTSPKVMDVIFLILQILGLFAVLLIGSIVLIPRLLHVEKLWKSKGSIEGIVTASFFGAAGIAAFVGLSPIVGAFAVGMAVAGTRLIRQVDEYAEKLLIIFGPLFFAIIGAQVDLRGVNLDVLYLSGIVIVIAVVTKIVGCGLPSLIFLKDKTKALRVGIGMVSRGEVGLIVAGVGVGVSAGVLTSDIYTTVIIMVALTTIITPIWLKKSFKSELAS